mmetsp:Transcript_22675/g.89708  ORF Transcript_22675/g.89708 Transcript_22675/m.89708 type:complete len:475 (+) Transcript_22675:49-1473(+)
MDDNKTTVQPGWTLFRDVCLAHGTGDFKKATELAREAVVVTCGSSDAYAVLAYSHLAQNKPHLAQAAANEALAKRADSLFALIALGKAYLAADNGPLALQVFRSGEKVLKTMRLHPAPSDTIDARRNLGACEQELKTLIQQSMPASGDHLSESTIGVLLRSISHVTAANLNDALMMLDSIIATDPNNLTALLRKAELLKQFKRYHKGAAITRLSLYARIAELDPSSPTPGLETATICLYIQLGRESLGMSTETIEKVGMAYLRRALALDPTNIEVLRLWALQLSKRGSHLDALKICNRVIKCVLEKMRNVAYNHTRGHEGLADVGSRGLPSGDIQVDSIAADGLLETVGVTADELKRVPSNELSGMRKWIAFTLVDRSTVYWRAAKALESRAVSSSIACAKRAFADAAAAADILPGCPSCINAKEAARAALSTHGIHSWIEDDEPSVQTVNLPAATWNANSDTCSRPMDVTNIR